MSARARDSSSVARAARDEGFRGLRVYGCMTLSAFWGFMGSAVPYTLRIIVLQCIVSSCRFFSSKSRVLCFGFRF